LTSKTQTNNPVNQNILAKLEKISERVEEINALLAEPSIISNNNKFRELSMEHAQLTPVAEAFGRYRSCLADLQSAEQMAKEDDAEMRALAQDEIKAQKARREELTVELQKLLLPKDPYDGANVFLEIRAGTGGDEAAIFSGDLFRMYSKYAERNRWKIEVLNESHGEHGGYKEIIVRVSGKDVYSHLKFESGAHRVQRVPATETQGRIHTSACTVAILPEPDEIEQFEINPADLKVDTFRASGAGGQHVNKTDSAIRITHLPTGTVVECQDERSQHKNRSRAMSILQARLTQAERDRQAAATAATRKSLVGSGDRSERIRTYNYPQGRITDHRINVTVYKLESFMEGDIDMIIEPLNNEYQAEQLTALNEGAL